MSMISFVIGVLGLFLSCYFFLKQQKKKEISHFLINSYDIGMGLKNEFPEFSILYNDEEMAKYVRVYEGCFLNTGNRDIYKSNEDIELEMTFPEKCFVKAIKIAPSTEDLIVSAITGEKSNEVKFSVKEIIKTNERINYIAIVESAKPINGSHDALHFKHRIPDTDSIQDGDKQYENKKRRNHRAFELILFILFVLFIVCEVLLYLGKYPFLNLYVSSQIPFALVVITLLLYLWYDKRTDKKYLKLSDGL